MRNARDGERRSSGQITVLRPGALGDTLLTLPALAALRHRWPTARITFIARADTLPLAIANGLADRAWPWELPDWSIPFAEEPTALTERARAELGDAERVILWAPDPEGALADKLRVIGARQALVAPALPQSPAQGAESMHAAAWLIETLRPLGVSPPTHGALNALLPVLRAPASDEAQADALWRAWGFPGPVVALHPGAGSPGKRWPAERFAEVAWLARTAGYTPLLLAGEADAQALAETRAALAWLDAETPDLQEARDLPLATLAALLERCAGYIGNDSGVSHLAGLVGVSTVAIFGPTNPARWSPLGPHVRALRSPDARLDQLSADTVWAALRTLLAQAPQGAPQ